MVNHPIILPLAIIGDENFRLYELSAFIELKRTISSTHSSLIYPYSESCSIYQHDLLRLHSNDIQIKNVHTFETISIDQIFDKFPHYDGLKDLFERNPDGSFFLIKFWADVSISPSIINSIINRDESFFTSYTYASCSNRPIHISTRLCSFGKQVLEKVEISEYPQRDQFDQFIYRFDRSPLCDYMVQFIQKLRSLPNTYMMNSVLEVRFLFFQETLFFLSIINFRILRYFK
jgi:transcriptional enhancer factor